MTTENQVVRTTTRRDFLSMTAVAAGACGLAISAIPFIRAMGPAKDILAAGLMEVDISGIKEGEFRVLMWRKQPVFILRRTRNMIDQTARVDTGSLRDPAAPEERVKKPDLLVCIGICTHLGCIPIWQPEKIPGLEQPGFYCPCHGGKFDTLGRRLDGPPPENLHLVPYSFAENNRLMIGSATFSGYGDNIRKIGQLPMA
jgi:ubiquinol-cytochrome c reductase iron-sulfur subunit